jgi:hypothetical protein
MFVYCSADSGHRIMVADRYPILNAPARKKTMEKIDSLTDKLRETAIPASQTITAELLTEEPAVDAEEPGNEIEDTSCVLTTQVAETMEALIPQGKEAESVSIPDSPTIQSGGHEDTQVDAGQPKILGETPESENSCSALKGGNIEPDPLLQFEFMMAVMDGNLADVQRLLGENRHQLDIDEVEPGLGQPPITVAIVFNHVAMVKVLIAAGANVDIADNKGCAPLAHAMQNGNTNLMKILLDAGADKMPENPPKWGLEPPATYLFQSVKIQRKDMLELLLDAGVDAAKIAHNINRGSWAHETSPLVVAVGFHHDIGIARRLLEAHVDPNAPSGCTLPLSRAAMTSGKDMVELLLDHGADPDQQNGRDCPRFWCEQKEELNKVLVRSAMKKSMRGKTQGSKG